MADAIDVALLARPLAFAALAALAFAPLERVAPLHDRRRGRAGLAADLAFATVGQIAVKLGVVFVVGAALWRLDGVALERPPWGGAPAPARTVLDVGLGLVVFDLGGYLHHRLAHRVRWMWRLHEVHHSSPTMDWLAAFRQHPVESVMLTLAQNAPLVLLGIPLAAHAMVLVALKLTTVFVHANVRTPGGALALAVATPRFHHRHHDKHGAVKNFASLFPLIDVAFGTHSAEASAEFGVPHATPDTFVGLLLHPLRRRRERS